MDDVRWFAPNRYCTLIVPWLRDRGLSIALDGDGPARVAIAMDAQVAAEACRYAARHRCPLIHYVWDLPPWWLGRGRHDWVWQVPHVVDEGTRSEEHTSELQSHHDLVCRLLLEKKKKR